MRSRTALVSGSATLVATLALLGGCAKAPVAVQASAPPAIAATLPGGLQPASSILDLMLDPVDSSADFLWESVATVSTRTGVEEKQPHTDAEWKAVRQKALLLMEGANLLVVEGRVVAHPGQNLEEPGGKTDFTPAQAQAAIDKDRAAFVGFARALQNSGGQMLAAIDKRDAAALLEAGGGLDEVCESCHRRFWYPDSPVPPGQ